MNVVSEKNSKHLSRDKIQQGKTLLSEKLSNSDIEQESFIHPSVKESYDFETDENHKRLTYH